MLVNKHHNDDDDDEKENSYKMKKRRATTRSRTSTRVKLVYVSQRLQKELIPGNCWTLLGREILYINYSVLIIVLSWFNTLSCSCDLHVIGA